MWLEIQPFKANPFIVGFVYRPPNSTVDSVYKFQKMLEKVYAENEEIIILGGLTLGHF